MANEIENPEPTVTDLDGNRWIKAVIISLTQKADATHATRKLLTSIQKTGSRINPLIMDATTPETIYMGLSSVSYLKGKDVPWTWPDRPESNGLDLRTGLYKKAYLANDQNKVIACMISHMRAWQYAIDINEPVMVLEQDAFFMRRFSWEQISDPEPMQLDDVTFRNWCDTKELQVTGWDIEKRWQILTDVLSKEPVGSFVGGILGLNSPIGATRKASVFHNQLFCKYGFHKVPSVDSMGDDPLPQGLAGNSAYIIKPWAAKKLLDKVLEIGMWPNDALMCKQFFPWMQVCWPYYTVVQGTPSSTTG
jgi:GR25 family glycosyltransferase involved in LPS biosynthesis